MDICVMRPADLGNRDFEDIESPELIQKNEPTGREPFPCKPGVLLALTESRRHKAGSGVGSALSDSPPSHFIPSHRSYCLVCSSCPVLRLPDKPRRRPPQQTMRCLLEQRRKSIPALVVTANPRNPHSKREVLEDEPHKSREVVGNIKQPRGTRRR